jgi:hypothetical protein
MMEKTIAVAVIAAIVAFASIYALTTAKGHVSRKLPPKRSH